MATPCLPAFLGPHYANYNILAFVGLEWGKMEYHDSAVGRGIPPEVVIKDRAMQISQ